MQDSIVPAGREGGSKTAVRLACVALLGIHAVLALDSLRQHNVTIDEGGHLLSGLLAWEDGRVDVYPVNPPLVKVLMSFPIFASRPELPESVRWNVSKDWIPQHMQFVTANRHRYQELLVRARCVLVLLSVLGGWLVFRWSRELFGTVAGLTALALWAFSPNVLTWSGVCTVDLGAAVLGLAAMYAVRSYFRRPGWASAVGAGTMLGLAMLAKFTLLIYFLVWVLLWLAAWWSAPRTLPLAEGRVRWSHFLLVLLLCVLIVNVGYGFQGAGQRLGDFRFRCHALTSPVGDGEARVNRFTGTWLGPLPVPLPEVFVTGLDEQRSHVDRGFPAYLRGQWQDGGWWYYYLYVLAVKVPLGTWVLAGTALLLAWGSPRFRAAGRQEGLLWLPAAGVLFLMSSQPGLDGFGSPRYLLPAFPFLFIGISRVGLCVEDAWSGLARSRGIWRLRLIPSAVILAALVWNAASTLRTHPHYLSYFNESAGGPDQGWNHLIESNIDWGQDLLFLKRWADEHPEASPLGLACYAGMPPSLAGLDYGPVPHGPDAESAPADLPRQGPRPGWYAVGANLVCGMSCADWDPRGRPTPHPRNAYRYFRFFTPVAKAGYSIFIYHITAEEADRVRSRLGLPPLSP